MRNQHAVAKKACNTTEAKINVKHPTTGQPIAVPTAAVHTDYHLAGGPKWTPEGNMAWPAPTAAPTSYYPNSGVGCAAKQRGGCGGAGFMDTCSSMLDTINPFSGCGEALFRVPQSHVTKNNCKCLETHVRY